MSKVDQFKKLIKEAVREVLKEEGLLFEKVNNETKSILEQNNRFHNIKEDYYTGTPKNNLKYQSSGDPLIDLLNETRNEGEWRNLGGDNFNTSQLNHFSPPIGNIGDMLSNTNKNTADINQVSVDVVPNFSHLMNNMKEKGMI